MKRFNFNTFLTDDANRAAYDICRQVAELAAAAPMPVLLLGDEGCGKTHLLYAIVNRIKAASPRTSLAYVTAREFRREVRELIGDPSPVEKAETAILLVDQLERFDDRVEELEAVVRIFLDNNHYVLLASNVHPRRLQALPQGLKEMIATGQTVEIRPREGETQVEVMRRELRRESQAVIEKQRNEIDRLRGLLERVGATEEGGEAPATEALREQLRQERASRTELAERLKVATEFSHSLQDEVTALQNRIDQARNGAQAQADEELEAIRENAKRQEDEAARLRAENERLQNELQHRSDAEEEVEQLRESLEAAQAEKNRALAAAVDEHAADREQLETRIASLQEQLETQDATLRQQLEQAQRESEQARHEANMLLERAEKLLSQIETNQARFRETEHQQQRQIEELEALLAERSSIEDQSERVAELQTQTAQTEARLQTAEAELAQQRRQAADELDELRQRLEADASRAETEARDLREALERAEAERDDLRQALEGAQTERDDLRQALEGAQAERDELSQAVDNAQAERERMEAALLDSRAEHDVTRSALEKAEEEREALRTSLDESNGALAETRQRLEDAGQRLASQNAEMEALRHEAAAQVAEANAQAGELEGRLAQLQARFDRTTGAGKEVAGRLERMQGDLAEAAGAVDELRKRLASAADQSEFADANGDASWGGAALREAMGAAAAGEPAPAAEWGRPRRDLPQQAGHEASSDMIAEPQASQDDEDFNEDGMILPPAPDEEDLDEGLPAGEGAASERWEVPDLSDDIGLPQTPMQPLQDLSPLEDEKE